MPHPRTFALALVTAVTGLASTASAATYTVTKQTDDPASTACTAASCSLRAAVDAAELASTDSTINVPVGSYSLAAANGGLSFNPSSGKLLTIRRSLNATGAATIVGPPSGGDPVLSTGPVAAVTLENLTISGGKGSGGSPGGISVAGSDLNLTNVTVSGNSASPATSGAEQDGGGIAAFPDSGENPNVTLFNSTVSGNSITGTGEGFGGGIFFDGGTGTTAGKLVVDSSLIEGNASPSSAGIRVDGGSFLVSDSTLTGNTSAADGTSALHANVAGTISQTTIAGNSGRNGVTAGGGPITLKSAILAQGATACRADGGSFADGGSNLDSGTTCGTGGLKSTDPQLGGLTLSSGSATRALIPRSSSPVIDAGGTTCPSDTAGAATGDQRFGKNRPADGNGDGTAQCDIGAVEYQRPTFDAPTFSGTSLTATNVASAVFATDAAVTAHLEYGRGAAFDKRTADIAAPGDYVNTAVSAPLTGLDPGVSYQVRLVVSDGARTFASAARSVTTAASPRLVVGNASNLAATSATLNGTLDPNGVAPTLVHFEYGATPAFGTSTPDRSYPTGLRALAEAVTGLKPSTTYYYRVVGSGGGVSFASASKTFTTLAAPAVAAPVLTTKLGTLGTLSLRKVVKSGYKVKVTCSATCTLKGSLSVTSKQRKSLKLRSATLISVSSKTSALKFKLGRKAASRLKAKKVKTLTLSVTATPTASGGKAVTTKATIKVAK